MTNIQNQQRQRKAKICSKEKIYNIYYMGNRDNSWEV